MSFLIPIMKVIERNMFPRKMKQNIPNIYFCIITYFLFLYDNCYYQKKKSINLMGSNCCSKTKIITITNSLDTQVQVQCRIKFLTTDSIVNDYKVNGKINMKKEPSAQLEGQSSQGQRITAKQFTNFAVILKGGKYSRVMKDNQSVYMILRRKLNQKQQQQQFHGQLLNNSEESYCIWQPNNAKKPALIPTNLKDNWRFLPNQAQTYNQNYPDQKFCHKCLQTKGCKQNCQNLKQLKGLTLLQVQNIFKKQMQFKKDVQKKVPRQSQKPQNNENIGKNASKSSLHFQKQIDKIIIDYLLKQKQKYAFDIDMNHPHVKEGAFIFYKNIIIKNQKDMPGWYGGNLVSKKPFPQKGWHQIKLWVCSQSATITLGLVNEQSKDLGKFRADQHLQYNGNVNDTGIQGIIFNKQIFFGNQQIPGGIMNLILRVSIEQKKASFGYYQNEDQNQKEKLLIDIPNSIIGQNKKVYPYVGIAKQNDMIMFI